MKKNSSMWRYLKRAMIDLGGAYVMHSISFLSIEDVKQGL